MLKFPLFTVLAICFLTFQVQASPSWNLWNQANTREKTRERSVNDYEYIIEVDTIDELEPQTQPNNSVNSDKIQLTFGVTESPDHPKSLLATCEVKNFNILLGKKSDYVISFFRTSEPLVKHLLGQYDVFVQTPKKPKESQLFYRKVMSNTEIAKGPQHTLPTFDLSITNYPKNQTETFNQNYWCELTIKSDYSYNRGRDVETKIVSNTWVQVPIVTLSAEKYSTFTCTIEHFTAAEAENSPESYSVAFYYDFNEPAQPPKLVGTFSTKLENGEKVVEFASAYNQTFVRPGDSFEYPVFQLKVVESARSLGKLYCKLVRDNVSLNGSSNWREVISNVV